MPERRAGQHRRGPRERPPATLANFYQSVLTAGETEALTAATAAGGVADELALLRILVRRQLAEQPENLDLTLKALTLLARLVATQFRLSATETDALAERVAAVADQLRDAILSGADAHAPGEEGGPDGEAA